MNCRNPYIVKTVSYHPGISDGGFRAPCGQCLACRIQRTAEWAMRLQHEFQYWDSGYFITLTYAPENVPWASAWHGDHLVNVPTLSKVDLQKFFKRFRKNYAKEKKDKTAKIRYFAGAEYGQYATTHPHYHAIVFINCSNQKMQSLVKESWPFGLTHVGSCTYESICYVAGYIQKKWYGDPTQSPNYPAVEPFSLQSQKLGKQFVVDNEKQLINNGYVAHRGAKRKLPRYYRRFIHMGEAPKSWTLLWKNLRNNHAEKLRRAIESDTSNNYNKNVSNYEKNRERLQQSLDQFNYDLENKLNQNPKGDL